MLRTTGPGQRKLLLLVYASVIAAVVSCQIVAGVQSRKLDPWPPGCALPNVTGMPFVRVANFVPTTDVIDVCIRPAGTSSWGRPILLNGGVDSATQQSCLTQLGAKGFSYGQVSVPFSAPATQVDVEFIPGNNPCTVTAIAEKDGITLATNAVTTLLNLGGNGQPNQIAALAESDVLPVNSQNYRVVHAAPGITPIDFGKTTDPTLPTTVEVPLLSQPIAFGGTEPSTATGVVEGFSLIDNGYTLCHPGKITLGASLDGDASEKALFDFYTGSLTQAGQASVYSIYMVGVAGDDVHPLRALVCDEDSNEAGILAPNGTNQNINPLLIPCYPSPLASISAEVFNTSLYGVSAPYFQDRKPLIPGLIATQTPDVMCVTGIGPSDSRDSIIQVAKQAGVLVNSFFVSTNLDSQPTDPKDQNGNTPPQQPASAACPDSASQAAAQAIATCMEDNCSTAGPGDPTGSLSGHGQEPLDCLSAYCLKQTLDLQKVSVNCSNCMFATYWTGSDYGDAVNACDNNIQQTFTWGGQTEVLLLSRYPLINTASFLLPATYYRRAILYAQMQLEDQTVDVYCGDLDDQNHLQTLIYNGYYGGDYGDGGAASANGWRNENLFQAQKLIDWVAQKSGASDGGPGNPALVLGDWESSIGIIDSADAGPPPGAYLPLDLIPNTMDLLEGIPFDGGPTGQTQKNWTPVVDTTSGTWAAQCNRCPTQENPLNGSDQFFVAQPFLVNWPGTSAAVKSEILTFNTGAFTPTEDVDAGPNADPISQDYGVNFTVVRPH